MSPARTTRRAAPRRRPAGRSRSRRGRGRGRRTTPAALTVLARWWPALLVTVAVFAGAAWQTGGAAAVPVPVPVPTGVCTAAGVALSQEQTGHAATIAGVARNRGLSERAVVIGLATAMQESRLRNLDYGDRDSLGLFQQRPSQGWGTPEQVRDPVYAAGEFYERLVTVPGWETGRLTEVAQAVQRSGFPEAYQKWEPMAAALAAGLAPDTRAPLPCR